MPRSTLTAAQAMTAPVAIGRAVIAALGTSGWTLTIGPDAESCTLPDGGTGMNGTWSASGPGSTTEDRDAATVAAALERHGYEVSTQKVGGGGVRVVGCDAAVGAIEFDTQASSTSVIATSNCVTGDAEHYRSAPAEKPVPSSSPTPS